jgi:hypothetical protein
MAEGRQRRRKWTWGRVSRLGRWLADYWILALILAMVAVAGFVLGPLREWRRQAAVEAKRPVLSIRSSPLERDTNGTYIRFKAHNDGATEAVNFQWHILIPKDAPVEAVTGYQGDIALDGVMYSEYSLIHVAPVYRQAPQDVLTAKQKNDGQSGWKFPVLWRITLGDRMFPDQRAPRDSVKYGRIEIDLPARSSPR